jgi:hypothetical protein
LLILRPPFNFLFIKIQKMTFWRKISNRRGRVYPFPNIRSSNNEIIGSSLLIIIWTRNTNRGKIKNGVKCKTHIDRSRRENIIKCSGHTNKGRIENGIKWKKHIDKSRIKNKIRCKK